MSRVYCVESTPSVSGSVADHRMPLRSDRIHAFLLEVAGWRPACAIESFTAERVRDGVYEIEAALCNTGRLPALPAMAGRSRRFATDWPN